MIASKLKSSLGFRLFIIGFLNICLFIPSLMIQDLIHEREQRRIEAINEVGFKWGNQQIVSGPILNIPYYDYHKNEKERIIKTLNYLHILPESLHVDGQIEPERRYRGIYEIVVYNSELQLKGKFKPSNLEKFNISVDDIIWKDITLSVGISDMKGIKDRISIRLNGKNYEAEPGIESKDIHYSGLSVYPERDLLEQKFEFEFSLNLNGSQKLMFAPIGKETIINLKSNWNNPKFTGSFLPKDRIVSENGFEAKWKVLNLNRNYPQSWKNSSFRIEGSNFGVELLLPVDDYQKTIRTSKYAIMFIALTFISFFITELLSKNSLHPIQYLLIGFAILIFYTLLLSFSEHMLFKYAYLLASSGIIMLISLYTRSVLKSNNITLIITGILTLLYGYLYIILQLQDYALLIGSLGLFLILSLIMYLTRKINWFDILKTENRTI